MLKLDNVNITVNKKEILKKINLSFKPGKIYFLIGKNGSGKSSLALSIMGHPDYKINSGKIILNNKDITNLSPDKKNKLGIFLSFQNIPEIQGIKLIEYLRSIYNEFLKTEKKSKTGLSLFLFKKFITPFLNEFNIKESFLKRDLNVGFSGGEKRKIELLQIALLKSKYIILDEIDAGMDIDTFNFMIKFFQKIKNNKIALIFITHNFLLADKIGVDEVYVIEDGKLKSKGNKKLIDKIKKTGFLSYKNQI